MFKEVDFSHNDLDGAGCRIVYELAHIDQIKGKDYQIYNCALSNGKDNINSTIIQCIKDEIINRDTKIIFNDLCPDKELLQKLKDNNFNIKIFDHHITNLYATEIIPDAVVKISKDNGDLECGTNLLYNYYLDTLSRNGRSFEIFNSDMMKQFIENIRLYDTYEFKKYDNQEPKKLQTLFFLLGMDRFCNRYIERLKGKDNILITPYELEFIDARIEHEQKIIDELTPDDVYQINIKGYKAALILGTRGASISECANQFLNKYSQFDLVVLFNMARGGAFSFRAISDHLNLVEDLGFLGHAKAAVWPLPPYILDQIIAIIVNALNK